MKRPAKVDEWTWEYPGYWCFRDEDLDRAVTIGHEGVQITTADLSDCIMALGNSEDPKGYTVVGLYECLGANHLDYLFESVVYLVLRGEYEFNRVFKST